jgi:hypothetical protein
MGMATSEAPSASFGINYFLDSHATSLLLIRVEGKLCTLIAGHSLNFFIN